VASHASFMPLLHFLTLDSFGLISLAPLTMLKFIHIPLIRLLHSHSTCISTSTSCRAVCLLCFPRLPSSTSSQRTSTALLLPTCIVPISRGFALPCQTSLHILAYISIFTMRLNHRNLDQTPNVICPAPITIMRAIERLATGSRMETGRQSR